MFSQTVANDNSNSMASDPVRICNPISPRPHPSTEAIISDQRSRCPRMPLVIDYHPGLPDISSISRKYYALLLCSEKFSLALPEVPIVTFRLQPDIRNV